MTFDFHGRSSMATRGLETTRLNAYGVTLAKETITGPD
jgi:hypothetical protein